MLWLTKYLQPKVPSGRERLPNASALSPTEISPGLLILYDFWISSICLFIDIFLHILNLSFWLLYFISAFCCYAQGNDPRKHIILMFQICVFILFLTSLWGKKTNSRHLLLTLPNTEQIIYSCVLNFINVL